MIPLQPHPCPEVSNMRFLHTADWQMGQAAIQLGGKADIARHARMIGARRVMALARDKGVDFVVVAGDTFEHNGVSRVLVNDVARLLGSCGCPVYLIPGNHDSLEPGSVWENPCWAQYSNICILNKPEAIPITGGTLFPCPISESYSSADPTSWISGAAGSGVRIGIAHGSVEDDPDRDHSHPIAREAATRGRLDYLALGHYHSQALYNDATGAVHMVYSGTHEPTSFGERDSGNILLVEIETPGSTPRVTVIPTAELTWKQIRKEVLQPGQLAALWHELQTLTEPEKTLLDCRIEGTLFAEEQGVAADLEALSEKFCFVRMDLSRMVPETGPQWTQDVPAGYFLRTVQKLAARASEPSATPSQRLALRLAASFWREVNA